MYFKMIKLLLFLFLPLLLFGQSSFDRQLSRNRSQLNSLKNEISQIKSKLNSVKKNEISILDQLTLIDKQTALTARAKGLLEQENRILRKKIKQTNKRLEETRQRYEQLKNLYAKRTVYAYKYGKIRSLELLLSSSSVNQAFIRYRYLQKIAEHDERSIRSILKRKREIENLKQSLDKDLQQKRRNLIAKKEQEAEYISRRKEKAALLKKIRWNEASYSKQLSIKEKEKENLIQMIIELERQRQEQLTNSRKSGEEPLAIDFKFDDFSRAKGKLPWPVKGKVVTRYGKHKDKGSKTYTRNTDIEIKSKLGTPVHCVFKGVVRVITYLPGYGKTIIVDHGKGYYSVYSHLDEIYVQKDDGIKTGQVIAAVGDSGSLAGAKLQFGIYGKQRTYNPEKWLR